MFVFHFKISIPSWDIKNSLVLKLTRLCNFDIITVIPCLNRKIWFTATHIFLCWKAILISTKYIRNISGERQYKYQCQMIIFTTVKLAI